jgi:hypothetical protein
MLDRTPLISIISSTSHFWLLFVFPSSIGRVSLGEEEASAALRRPSPSMLLPCALAVTVVLACWCAACALEWAWWRPQRLGAALRSQGLRGTVYRPVAGDEPLNARLNREARSRALPLRCHDVVSRAMPLLNQLIKDNGACSACLLLFRKLFGTSL